MESLVTYFAYPVALLAMWRLWRERAVISIGDASVMWGVIATVALLACPFLSGEYAHRLSLMAPVPTAMLCVFLCVRRTERGMAHWPSAIVALVALAPTAAALGWVPSPGPDARRSIAGMAILSDADAAEMEVVRTYIAAPTKTLVVAPHGLEWWAGYYLKTAVAEGRPPEDAYLRYDFVYYLEQVRGGPGVEERVGPGRNLGPDGAFRPDGEPGRERPSGLQFRDIDMIYSGEHLRLFEYPIPGEDPEDE